ncbi:MAG: RNA polymerase sigma factor [Bryobacteraceae bacterium]
MMMAEQAIAVSGAPALLARFASWMAAEQRRIFFICQRMLSDADEADSAVQDTFFKAYQALERHTGELDDPGRWLARIAVNTCLDRLRSKRWQFWRKRPAAADEETILAMAASSSPDAEDQAFARQVGQRLARGLEGLSGRQRAVFTLRHYEDRGLEEIAQILDLDVGTVKAHLSRALAKLREELKDLYGMRKQTLGKRRH